MTLSHELFAHIAYILHGLKAETIDMLVSHGWTPLLKVLNTQCM